LRYTKRKRGRELERTKNKKETRRRTKKIRKTNEEKKK
jgi:hypothetical protein